MDNFYKIIKPTWIWIILVIISEIFLPEIKNFTRFYFLRKFNEVVNNTTFVMAKGGKIASGTKFMLKIIIM